MSDITNSTQKIQLESVQTGNPVSEAALVSMGGAINYALTNGPRVGDVMASDLDEATFQSLRDNTWVLSDGRSCVGTVYQSLTGRTTLPDRRGTFLRMKDYGVGRDAHGDQAIGTYQPDQFASHTHQYQSPDGGSGGGSASGTTGRAPFNPTSATGGGETAPKYTVINFFVKVNI